MPAFGIVCIIEDDERGNNMNLINIENLTKSYTERKLFDGASFSLQEGMADKEAAESMLNEKMDRWMYLEELAARIAEQ